MVGAKLAEPDGALTIGTHRFQHHRGRKPPELKPGMSGWWKPLQRGVLIHDTQNEPFVYVVNNRFRERFLVSCSRRPDGRIWFMHSVASSDWKRLDLPESYIERSDLANALIEAANRIDRRTTWPEGDRAA